MKKYVLFVLLTGFSILLSASLNAQTEEDLKLSYKNELVESDILVCNDGEPPFHFQLKNETELGKFLTFKLRLEDGGNVIDMAKPGETQKISYEEKGKFKLQFIGVKANGSEVVKSYSLKIVGKVNARLEKENELVKCLESEVKYTLLLLSGDTDGTQYF